MFDFGFLESRSLITDILAVVVGHDDGGYLKLVGCDICEYEKGGVRWMGCGVDGDGFLCYINKEGREAYVRNKQGECIIVDFEGLGWGVFS